MGQLLLPSKIYGETCWAQLVGQHCEPEHLQIADADPRFLVRVFALGLLHVGLGIQDPKLGSKRRNAEPSRIGRPAGLLHGN
jgi:hypothetical protein